MGLKRAKNGQMPEELFDKLCKEHGVKMIDGNAPVLRVNGKEVKVTKENIKDIILPFSEKINYFRYK